MTSNSGPSVDGAGSLYARAMEATRRYVAGIQPRQWTAPTPCTEWDVRQLLNHVVYEMVWVEEVYAGRTVAEIGDHFDGDVLGPDPLAAYDAALASASNAVQAPGAMETTCHLRRGDVPGTAYASSMFTDVFIHGWDIAKATGQDTVLDPDLVGACYAIVEARREQRRGSRAFASEIEVPDDADLQTKLLGMMGRRG